MSINKKIAIVAHDKLGFYEAIKQMGPYVDIDIIWVHSYFDCIGREFSKVIECSDSSEIEDHEKVMNYLEEHTWPKILTKKAIDEPVPEDVTKILEKILKKTGYKFLFEEVAITLEGKKFTIKGNSPH